MVFNKLHILYVLCICFTSFAFSQVSSGNLVLVQEKKNKIKVYKSKGFVENVDSKNSSNIDDLQSFNLIVKPNDIDDLRDDELQMAFSHAKLKLDRAILFFDQEDIERYTDFVNRIIVRLKQLGEL